MRSLLALILLVVVSKSALSQDRVFKDPRDNQQYRYTEINGLKWMLDNLNYFTELSFDLSPEINDTLMYRVPDARWYHLLEINKVCPDGWRLPTGDEWLDYVKSRIAEKGTKYSEGTYKSDYAIWLKGKQKIGLYEAGNPLALQPIGIFEGQTFYQYPGSADYWIQDIPMIKDVGKKSGKKAVKVTYENRSHVHLFPDRTNFHSHQHHLSPDDPDKMRRFLVRCVCESE